MIELVVREKATSYTAPDSNPGSPTSVRPVRWHMQRLLDRIDEVIK